MQNDILMIDLPKYNVAYEEEVYSYSPGLGRKNLKNTLYQASKDYCMYCYNRIKIDGNQYGHLEHAIEKSVSEKELTDCIPNIGISCPVCNDKYKRIGEKGRKPGTYAVALFQSAARCKEKFCKEPCAAYIALKKAYLENKDAHFLMQPLGVRSEDIGIMGGRELKLQYDVIEEKFVPDRNEEYTEEEIGFIQHHIDMFCLNSLDRRSTQLIKFLSDTIQHDGKYTEIEYNNQVVELFVNQLLKGKEEKEILKICEKLYTYACLKFYS